MTITQNIKEIDCQHCGKSTPITNAVACVKCGEVFAFLSKSTSAWDDWDYPQWIYAYHFQIADLEGQSGYSSLTRSQQLIFLIGSMYYHTLNGGLWQYFGNPCGLDAPNYPKHSMKLARRALPVSLIGY